MPLTIYLFCKYCIVRYDITKYFRVLDTVVGWNMGVNLKDYTRLGKRHISSSMETSLFASIYILNISLREEWWVTSTKNISNWEPLFFFWYFLCLISLNTTSDMYSSSYTQHVWTMHICARIYMYFNNQARWLFWENIASRSWPRSARYLQIDRGPMFYR